MSTDWTFQGTWPYEPKWFDTPEGRMHYIDEGEGRPVVMVHGNPTWGYLYRHFVDPVVEAGYRVIVPDLLGFGRSDKPKSPAVYQIGPHADRLDALLESLDLHDVTAVVQDWGGPIGLSWAVRHPERVRSLFILNTFAHRPRGKVKLPFIIKLFRTPGIGELMVKGAHVFVRGFMFRQGVKQRDRLTPEVKRAYLEPHGSWSSRTPILVFPREIPAGPEGRVSDLMAPIEAGLEEHFRSKPAHIAWPMSDPAFTKDILAMWKGTLPDAEITEVEGASHYIQEDAPEVVVPALVEFLKR
jgi:haloalkane dehalogenase